jgi:4-amino-4-deoxy-L-arabinose transferase-like glycosyltransferase
MQVSWLKLAAEFLPKHLLPRAALLFATTGMISVVSLIASPDVPLLLFWALSLLHLYRAIFAERRASWLIAGAMMGLAFDSKYTGVFLQFGLMLFLLASSAHRRWLRTPWPYLSLALAQVFAMPVYVWNAQHNFVSFLFQSAERATRIGAPQLRYLASLLATQATLLMPPLLIALIWLVARSRQFLRFGRPGRENVFREKALFFSSFFVPMAAIFVAFSVFALVKPNWLMPCYLSGLLLVPIYARRWWKWNLTFSAIFHLTAAAEVVLYPIAISNNDTWFGWKELASQVAVLSGRYPNAFLFSVDGYKTSAELSFYLQSKVYGPNVIGQRGLQFDYVGENLSKLQGRDALLITSTPSELTAGRSGTAPQGTEYFQAYEELDPILIFLRGRIIRKFSVYLYRHYRGPP